MNMFIKIFSCIVFIFVLFGRTSFAAITTISIGTAKTYSVNEEMYTRIVHIPRSFVECSKILQLYDGTGHYIRLINIRATGGYPYCLSISTNFPFNTIVSQNYPMILQREDTTGTHSLNLYDDQSMYFDDLIINYRTLNQKDIKEFIQVAGEFKLLIHDLSDAYISVPIPHEYITEWSQLMDLDLKKVQKNL